MFVKISALLTLLFLAGCSSVPESIQVADDNQLVNYPEVASQPDTNRDKVARWGGVIANVENLPEATMLEMVHYPLRSYGRPIISDQSIGRFRVYVDGFLDPMVYEKGRAVTFTGPVLGVEEGQVGDHNYQFPTLQANGYHLWKDIQRVEISGLHIWPHPYYHYYGHPYYGRHRVTIHGSNRYRGGYSSSSGGGSPSKPATRTSSSMRSNSSNVKEK